MTIQQRKTLVFFLGFCSSIAQVILVREFMSAFGGNELMLIFLMAGWFLGVALGAGRLFLFAHDTSRKSGFLFFTAGLLLPAIFVAARLIRFWLGIPPGQIVDAVFAGGLSALFAFPVSVVYGAIFCALSRDCRRGEDGGRIDIGRLYALEALGFVVGGIFVTGLLWIAVNVVTIVFFVFLFHLVLAVLGLGHKRFVFIFALAGFVFWATGALLEGEKILLQRQWSGFEVLAIRDSILGRVTIVKRSGQVSLFENGVLGYSVEDQMTAEQSVHYALLAHALPQKILLIGGGPGVVAEALQYPSARVDYVEMDPLAINLTRRFFPGAEKIFSDLRVRLFTGDGRRVVKAARGEYDAVLVNMSDPIAILINRYYTQEFFKETARALRGGGVFALSVGSSENYVSPENRSLLRMITTTLRSVFPCVKFIPGERVIFLASPSLGSLKVDIESFSERLRERGIKTKYVRPYYFSDRISLSRMSAMEDLLAKPEQINTDGRPCGLIRALVFWSTHFDRTFARLMGFCENPALLMLMTFLAGIVLVAVSFIPSLGITTTTLFVLGFTQMVMQSVILIYFQSMYGYLFGWIGFLTASFMLGTFLGGWSVVVPSYPLRALQVTQCLASFFFLFLAVALGGWLEEIPRWLGMGTLVLASVLVGTTGGRIFSLAAFSRKSTEGLYALDVLGAAGGGLLGGVILVPLLGVQASCVFCAGTGLLMGALVFIRRDGQPARKNALL